MHTLLSDTPHPRDVLRGNPHTCFVAGTITISRLPDETEAEFEASVALFTANASTR